MATVLIVEDDPAFAERCAEVVLGAHLEAVIAPTSERARLALREEQIQIVLIDLMLPPTFTGEGVGLLRVIREHHPLATAILMTQKQAGAIGPVAEAMLAGARTFLDKHDPFFDDQLALALGDVMHEIDRRVVLRAVTNEMCGLKVADLLRTRLKVEPLVLTETVGQRITIDRLERAAAEASRAVIVAVGDDSPDAGAERAATAHAIGFFQGALGRDRVIVLAVGGSLSPGWPSGTRVIEVSANHLEHAVGPLAEELGVRPQRDVTVPRQAGSSRPREGPAPTIGIVTALPQETAAVRILFGDPPRVDVPGAGPGRTYWLARIPSPFGGMHTIAIAQADMGNNIASIRADLLLNHFPTIDSIIMCGIAGGIPHMSRPEDHVRLGDIVVSNQKGVVQYDFVKRQSRRGTRSPIEEIRSAGHRPSALLLEMVRVLEADRLLGKLPWEELIRAGLSKLKWTRPEETSDVLVHFSDSGSPSAHPADGERRVGHPRVFYGPIASANKLLKDQTMRDALRDQFSVKAVEMEASGIADATWSHGVGYLVVRSICDYCDANKNDRWQRYAAVAASAYVRALLDTTSSAVGQSRRR